MEMQTGSSTFKFKDDPKGADSTSLGNFEMIPKVQTLLLPTGVGISFEK
jgi:hypothetical protein